MILMIDNNLYDHQLVRIAMSEAHITAPLHTAIDGKHGQEILQNSLDTGRRYQLVLLDLNMPRMHGRDLLSWIRDQPNLAAMPVIILTSSHAVKDREECLALGATEYLLKPGDFDGYAPLIQGLTHYLTPQ